MKNLLLIMAIPLLLMSCKDDDEKPDRTLVGSIKGHYTEITGTVHKNGEIFLEIGKANLTISKKSDKKISKFIFYTQDDIGNNFSIQCYDIPVSGKIDNILFDFTTNAVVNVDSDFLETQVTIKGQTLPPMRTKSPHINGGFRADLNISFKLELDQYLINITNVYL